MQKKLVFVSAITILVVFLWIYLQSNYEIARIVEKPKTSGNYSRDAKEESSKSNLLRVTLPHLLNATRFAFICL